MKLSGQDSAAIRAEGTGPGTPFWGSMRSLMSDRRVKVAGHNRGLYVDVAHERVHSLWGSARESADHAPGAYKRDHAERRGTLAGPADQLRVVLL